MFRKIVFGILLILIIGLALYAAVFGEKASKVTELSLNYRAEKEFEPEITIITFGVETERTNLQEALADNNQRMAKVIERLDQIEDVKYETSNFRLDSYSKKDKEDNEITYYRVLNQIQIQTTNLEGIGYIIQESINAGANQVLSLSYELEDYDSALSEVTKMAIKGIKEKAGVIADELGTEIVNIDNLRVNEEGLGRVTTYQARDIYMEKAPSPLPPITPGKLKIAVNINGEFSLQPPQ